MIRDAETFDLPPKEGGLIEAIAFYLDEYAEPEDAADKQSGELGHASSLLRAEEIRKQLTQKLQDEFVRVKEVDNDFLKEAAVAYYFWCYPKRRYNKEKLSKLIDEALSLAAGKTDNVVPVEDRYAAIQQALMTADKRDIFNASTDIGNFVFTVSFWLSEYARKESSVLVPAYGHVNEILAAEGIRRGLIKNLQDAFARVAERDINSLKEASLEYFLWCRSDRKYNKENLILLINEAFSVASGNMDNVVPVAKRFAMNRQQSRNTDGRDIYEGRVKRCLDTSFALGCT